MRHGALILVFLMLPAAGIAAPTPASQPAPAPAPLDAAFAALARAQSPEDARPLEERIGALFLQSGSASVDLLMARATEALGAADNETAIKLLGAVTAIAPRFAEGWHRRGELEAAAGDDAGAMIALQKTITLNPRQFAAMNELASMLEQYGDKAGALKLYRRVLVLDPQMNGVARHVQALAREIEGQGI